MKYGQKSNEILQKRNAYIKRRRAIITATAFSLIPIIIFCGVLFSFLNFRNNQALGDENLPTNCFYSSLEIEATFSSGAQNIKFSNLELVNSLMDLIDDKYENEQEFDPESTENEDSEYFVEHIDYLIKATDKTGKISIYCVTPNSILSRKRGNVYISYSDYSTIKRIIKENS